MRGDYRPRLAATKGVSPIFVKYPYKIVWFTLYKLPKICIFFRFEIF